MTHRPLFSDGLWTEGQQVTILPTVGDEVQQVLLGMGCYDYVKKDFFDMAGQGKVAVLLELDGMGQAYVQVIGCHLIVPLRLEWLKVRSAFLLH